MDALLVVDVQCGMFANPAKQPHNGEAVVRRISGLVQAARSASVSVIFVQHDGGSGHVLARGGPGFPFRPEMAPQGDEPVVVKHFCSAFQGTNLGDLLAAKEVRRVIICGMQTEYCVDTICRSAFERGYAVTLIGDAHTTFDSEVMAADEIIRHHNATLAGGFATVHAAEAVRFGARPA